MPIKDDEILLKALIAGDLDSFEGGPGSALIADSHGADVKIIGCTWLIVPHGIFVHDDITVDGSARGKTIAISSPGAFPDIFAKGALDHFNIPDERGEIRQPRRRSRPLQGAGGACRRRRGGVGRIRADRRQGAHQDAGSAQDALPHVRAHVSAFDRQDAQARAPHDAAKFLAGEMLGLRYAVTHKDEVMKVTQEVTGIKPDDPRPAYIYDLAMQQHAIGTDVPIPMDKFNWLNEELVKVGSIAEADGLSKVLDPKPREDALKLIAQMH